MILQGTHSLLTKRGSTFGTLGCNTKVKMTFQTSHMWALSKPQMVVIGDNKPCS
jgi:hypothetical protein